jgi:hypothetical protein
VPGKAGATVSIERGRSGFVVTLLEQQIRNICAKVRPHPAQVFGSAFRAKDPPQRGHAAYVRLDRW